MKRTKTFDCVQMKHDIQVQRAKEFAGLSDQEIAERMQHELDTSDHPVAVWYRKVLAHKAKANKPRESPVSLTTDTGGHSGEGIIGARSKT